jgi:hypothetical protein
MSERRAHRKLSRLAGTMAAGLCLMLSLAPASMAATKRFPVPSCKWVPTSLLHSTLGLQVRAVAPVWSTSIAPVLTCGYVERQPALQFGNVNIITVQFRELQRFKVTQGATAVHGLGSCIKRSSCPKPHSPAWLIETHSVGANPPDSGTGDSGAGSSTNSGSEQTPATGSGSAAGAASPPVTFISGLSLAVEDGLNALSIQVANPDGPVPVADETAQVEKLARVLLPHFLWR